MEVVQTLLQGFCKIMYIQGSISNLKVFGGLGRGIGKGGVVAQVGGDLQGSWRHPHLSSSPRRGGGDAPFLAYAPGLLERCGLQLSALIIHSPLSSSHKTLLFPMDTSGHLSPDYQVTTDCPTSTAYRLLQRVDNKSQLT